MNTSIIRALSERIGREETFILIRDLRRNECDVNFGGIRLKIYNTAEEIFGFRLMPADIFGGPEINGVLCGISAGLKFKPATGSGDDSHLFGVPLWRLGA